jgi:serine/threonine protein kinase
MEQSGKTNDESLEGAIIGDQYRVDRLLGSGGMGTVWLGTHLILQTRIAIKFIHAHFAESEEARARFEIEARAAASVKSKNAVQVYDYGVTENGLRYIVMEYLEGESLSDAIVRKGPLPALEVASIIAQTARALGKAHANGVVHRDLKPDNIFLAINVEDAEPSDLPYVVKIVDFGIAKMFDAPLDASVNSKPMGGPTQDGMVIGTPNFMSPEQLTIGGIPSPLTDLWALGASTFAAMTARIPFEGDVLGDIVLRVCVAPLPVPSKINPDVPAGFDGWFARACSREPTRRFQTAAELSESLSNVCGAGKIRVQTLSEDQVQYALKPAEQDFRLDSIAPRSMSPRTALAAGLLLGVALMVGVLGALAWHQREPEAATLAAPGASAMSDASVPKHK